MRHVTWSDRAGADLREIRAYVARDNAIAAQRLAERISAAADGLIALPHKGRVVRPGLRQIVAVYPYLIRYRIRGNAIEITRVYHGARNVRSPILAWRGCETPLPAR